VRQLGGAGLAFGAGYVIGDKDPSTRGVPPEHREALLKLVQGYSTRPGAQNIKLVNELGLLDYLCRRFAFAEPRTSASSRRWRLGRPA
jgi:hypothetical protein